MSALPTVVVSQLGRSVDYFSKQLLLSPVTTSSIVHSKCSEYFMLMLWKEEASTLTQEDILEEHGPLVWSLSNQPNLPSVNTGVQKPPHISMALFLFLLHVVHSHNYISTFLSHCLYFSMKVVPTLTTPQHFKDHYAGKMARWVRTLPQKWISEFEYPTPM